MTTSILDKLTNEASSTTYEARIIRDISNLLNTRNLQTIPTHFSEIETSILTYGLPNLAEFEAKKEEAARLVKAKIECILTHHEPRLKNIIVDINKIENFSISFSITATLLNEPDSFEIKFDSKYKPNEQQFDLNEHIET